MKERVLQIRISEELYGNIFRRAHEDRKTVSAYVRGLLEEEVPVDRPGVGYDPRSDDPRRTKVKIPEPKYPAPEKYQEAMRGMQKRFLGEVFSPDAPIGPVTNDPIGYNRPVKDMDDCVKINRPKELSPKAPVEVLKKVFPPGVVVDQFGNKRSLAKPVRKPKKKK